MTNTITITRTWIEHLPSYQIPPPPFIYPDITKPVTMPARDYKYAWFEILDSTGELIEVGKVELRDVNATEADFIRAIEERDQESDDE